MSPARRFEGLSLMQYTVTRSKHHFLPVSGKKKVRYLCDTSLRNNRNRMIALSNLDCVRPIHHQGYEHLAVHTMRGDSIIFMCNHPQFDSTSGTSNASSASTVAFILFSS